MLEDFKSRNLWSNDETQKEFSFRVAAQAMATLADFIQGPNKANQELFFKSKGLEMVFGWLHLIKLSSHQVVEDLQTDLPEIESENLFQSAMNWFDMY